MVRAGRITLPSSLRKRRAVRGKLFGCKTCAADSFSSSWPAIVPAIHAPGLLTRGHVFAAGKQDVDARAKPAHDDRSVCNPSCGLVGRAQEFSPGSPARKREPRASDVRSPWTPAFAGVTMECVLIGRVCSAASMSPLIRGEAAVEDDFCAGDEARLVPNRTDSHR